MVKVSVIIPVYNVENYLKECLDSIVNQTLKDIEIICINDGSTDNSLSILESYAEKDNRIKIISQENQGLGVVRNRGLDTAIGDYVYLIDSDDFLELNALEDLYNVAGEKSLDFVLFKLINLDDETNEYYTSVDYEMPDIGNLVKDNVFNYEDLGNLIFTMSVSAVNKFYNRDFVNRTGARFAEGLIFEDHVFFWEVLFNTKRLYFVQEYYYNRRRHFASITGSANIKFIDTLKIHNMIIDIFKKYNHFEKFKEELFNKKIRFANYRFSQMNNHLKPIFFDEMKKDFEEMTEEYGYSFIFDCLNKNNQSIFKNVIGSESSQEYVILMKKDRLEKDIKQMKSKNKKLKKEIKSIKKENKLMLNSKSWKITKPLRFITNLFK